MRALLTSPTSVSSKLGAAKVYLEVADGLRRLGWEATVVGPDQTGGGDPAALRDYLRAHAAGYDVAEYEHDRLPFPRSDFPPRTLFVARSVLLVHHFLTIPIPTRPGLRRRVGQLLLGRSRRRQWQRRAHAATVTCREADLVAVPTKDDAAALAAAGVPAGKVLVLPYALSQARRDALAGDPTPPREPVVGFVGTFDPRKGMRDFPGIVAEVCRQVPAARFRLIGTRGMLRTADEVLAEFPRRLRDRVEVVPEFDPADLPGLLAGCSVGVFPSSVEGFPFGVLEMLAAAVPVVAYRAPGPPAILPDEYLVAPGDAGGMAARVAVLLTDPPRLRAAREWARDRSADFNWDDVARRTADAYAAALARLRDP